MLDATGLLYPPTRKALDISLRRGMGATNPYETNESKGSGTFSNPFDLKEKDEEQSKREGPGTVAGFAIETGHWTFIKEISIWRVIEDNITRLIFRDELRYC